MNDQPTHTADCALILYPGVSDRCDCDGDGGYVARGEPFPVDASPVIRDAPIVLTGADKAAYLEFRAAAARLKATQAAKAEADEAFRKALQRMADGMTQ